MFTCNFAITYGDKQIRI